jgi:hypothetical protein
MAFSGYHDCQTAAIGAVGGPPLASCETLETAHDDSITAGINLPEMSFGGDQSGLSGFVVGG